MTPTGEPGMDGERILPPLGEVLEFMRVIWAVDHSLQRASKRMHKALGVTGPQRLVLRIVGRFPGIVAGRLAEILHVHPSTLTGILERLARQGLLSRRPDPRDRRRVRLGLTARGRALDAPSRGTVEDAVAGAIAALPRAKVRAAAEVLDRLARALEDARPA